MSEATNAREAVVEAMARAFVGSTIRDGEFVPLFDEQDGDTQEFWTEGAELAASALLASPHLIDLLVEEGRLEQVGDRCANCGWIDSECGEVWRDTEEERAACTSHPPQEPVFRASPPPS